MLLIVGLGNPGAEYHRNRHNVGFMALDTIAERHGFGPFRARFQGLASEGRLGGDKILVLKPQTYMNESGRSVGEALRFYKLDSDQIIVFHDEVDLAPGKVRVKFDGGHAGHNGLRSIDAHIGKDYRRVRVGVGHPGGKKGVAGHVLHDFSKADDTWLNKMLDAMADEAHLLVEGDDANFMNRVAMATAPPKPPAGEPDKGPAESKE